MSLVLDYDGLINSRFSMIPPCKELLCQVESSSLARSLLNRRKFGSTKKYYWITGGLTSEKYTFLYAFFALQSTLQVYPLPSPNMSSNRINFGLTKTCWHTWGSTSVNMSFCMHFCCTIYFIDLTITNSKYKPKTNKSIKMGYDDLINLRLQEVWV